jgi:hypothetical protein
MRLEFGENMEKNITTQTGETAIVTESETSEGTAQTAKTYTEAEVQALLQSEADRRVTSALKKQAEKFQKEQAEADKLRDMSDAQRKEYDYNKRVEELESKEKEFNLMQNKLSASKVMAERGLPVNFVDYIVADDAETMMTNITAFEKEWKAAIADAVSARLASSSPKTATTTQTGLSVESFKKMSVAQQAEIYKTNPELYKQLTGK